MSIYTTRNNISDKQVEIIRKILLISPITPVFRGQSYSPPDISKAVQAWAIEECEDGSTLIRLPYQVGRAILGRDNNSFDFDEINFEMHITLRESQVEPVKEAISILNQHGTVLLTMRMGKGKTIMSCYIAMKARMRTAVLTASVDMSRQWASEIRSKSNARAWVVGEESEPYEWDIALCYYSDNRWRKIRNRYKIGTLIIDECHEFNNTTGIQAVLAFSPRNVIACSGTFTRSKDQMHRVMLAVLGNHKVEIDDPIPLDVIRLNTGIQGTREQGKKGVNWTVLKQSLMNNETRNYQLMHCVKTLLYYGVKTLVISREVAHVKLLHSQISEFYPACDFICEKKSDYRDSMVTVGIIDKTGTGWDESNACSNWGGMRIRCVIVAISIGSLELTMQTVGRSFRHERPMVLYPVDNDSTVKRHFGYVKEWEKTGKIIPTYHNAKPENVGEFVLKLVQ